MPITMNDIADRVGVDRSTVSLALNDATASKLSPERVRMIRDVSREMGYRPNIAARQLRKRTTRCIGVVMNYLEYYPYNHYFNLISECCVDRGYHAVPLPMKHRDGRPHNEVELIENAAVDGLIVLEYDPAFEGYFRERREQSCPVVFRVTDPRAPMINQHHRVAADCAAGVTELICRSVKNGWDRLLLVVERDADRPNPFVDERGLLPYEARGIADAVRVAGIRPPGDADVITCPARWAKSRYEAVTQYLAHHAVEPGTLLLQCGADGVSGTYSALTNAGLVVGRDVAVATTNPTPPWEYVLPVASFTSDLHDFSSRWLVGTVIDLIESKPPRRKHQHSAVGEWRVTMTDSVPRRGRGEPQ